MRSDACHHASDGSANVHRSEGDLDWMCALVLESACACAGDRDQRGDRVEQLDNNG